jgi:F-type H+-transporting ATPase subunit b
MTMGLTTVVRRWALIGALAFAGIAGLSLCRAAPAQASEEERLEHAGKIEGGAIGSGLPAHHETPEIHGKSLALQLLNFAVLIFVLVKFGGPAISKALEARHQQLKADLAAAAAARAEAETRLAQQEARLAALEQEIEGIRTGVKAEAEAEKARLIAMAEERAKRIREETTFVLDQQVKEAEERLRREVALAAVTLAEQMVRQSLGAADQQRMVDSFVADVAAPAGAPAPRGQA